MTNLEMVKGWTIVGITTQNVTYDFRSIAIWAIRYLQEIHHTGSTSARPCCLIMALGVTHPSAPVV